MTSEFDAFEKKLKKVDPALVRVHINAIKPAAPLLACVIRWVFFCPDSFFPNPGGHP